MKRSFKIFQIFATVQFIVFIYLQVTPLPELPQIVASQDKYAHFFGFLISGGLVLFSFDGSVVLWFQLIVLSIMAESTQKIVPGRYFELYDILANLTGLSAAFFILKFRNFRDRN
ncbi:MAG: hypothetical protein QNL04_11790 [SAR324 cluster bacterium]|nr:hypothetical protein [SAR324 cluster bacterium]